MLFRSPAVQVRFRFENKGSLPNDLHVRDGDDDRGGTDVIGQGESADAELSLAPGDYELFCSVGDHAELGMTGDLKLQ